MAYSRSVIGYRFEKLVTVHWIWVTWEGEVVLYEKATGDTHRLRFPAGLVLDACSGKSQQSIEDLALALPAFDTHRLITKDDLVSSIDALCQFALLKSVPFEDIQPLSR